MAEGYAPSLVIRQRNSLSADFHDDGCDRNSLLRTLGKEVVKSVFDCVRAC